MLYCSWDMVHKGYNCCFSFWAIFCPFTPPPSPPPPLTAQKSKFQKNKKKHLEISWFYTHVPKTMIRWCIVPEIWCATDGLTDRWKKRHIEVGTPPKNQQIFFLIWFLPNKPVNHLQPAKNTYNQLHLCRINQSLQRRVRSAEKCILPKIECLYRVRINFSKLHRENIL